MAGSGKRRNSAIAEPLGDTVGIQIDRLLPTVGRRFGAKISLPPLK